MNRAESVIDLGIYQSNLRKLRNILKPNTQLMAVVKADAYGHGMIHMAHAAVQAGVDALAVAFQDEALRLRESNIQQPILIMTEAVDADFTPILGKNITLTLYEISSIYALQKQAKDKRFPVKVHLKVDTGMSRLGCSIAEAPMLIEKIQTMPELELEGIFTHFACSDEPSSPKTNEQLSRFNILIQKLSEAGLKPPIVHAANSFATLNFPDSHFDSVRVGLASYDKVLSIHSKVSRLTPLKKGESVSYGATWTTDTGTTLAVVPVGYADGLPLELSGKGRVLIKGDFYPIVGRICMDMFLVDLGLSGNNIERGEPVVILGKQGEKEIELNELVSATSSHAWELLCQFNGRLPKQYSNAIS